MKKNYNENLVAGAAIRDDKGRRISKLFEAPHPKMTVGYARNLIMPDDPTEQKFNFRQSGGGVIEDGVAVIDKVKGNSVVWNQLIKNGNFASTEEWVENGATISISNGEATITQTLEGDYGVGQKVNVIAGHKIMILMDVKEVTSMYVGVFRSQYDSVGFHSASNAKQINSVGFVSFFTTITELGNYKSYFFGFARGGANSSIKVRSVNLIDLTQMFRAGNEPTTYEEFLQRKPKVADEYAYNEGTIVNNKVEKVVTTGRNLWDEQIRRGNYDSDTGIFISRSSENYYANVNPIKVLGGKDYYHYTSNTGLTSIIDWYDADMNFIGEVTIPRNTRIVTSPSNACFANFWMYISSGISLGEKCCINISDPSINGKYFPYEEHTLDLAWVKDIKDAEGVKLFEDGLRSAGTAFDEVAKGRAIKRIGVMDMGKITWYNRNDISPSMFASNGIAPNSKIGLCPIASINKNTYDATLVDGVLYWMDKYIMMYNSKFTTIDDFVNFVSGTPIYYELAEPIEVEYDEKSLTYPVIAEGTEEAIAIEPSSAFRADIGYGIDAVKTILDLKARVEALERK